MTITLNRLAYQFGTDNNTSSVSVGLSGSQDSNSISASIQITADDITDGKTLDDMTKADFETLAKSMLAKLTAVTA
ncbi:hypothetical protein [Liquorilactobacillus mali]|uniref:Uncharacterized protein n=1 Tax=Liquorilactobacillus mali KCTC 3596 = DSM 20444 TaxID=1046596 RepID=J0L0Y7_9LACO|nr:hypothetical protein [Liquorilactobacillus mali]EJF01097.1 hypothetical protein LMA_01874 [Liquorilactobacillus mali KCTC 3596 = DSM 20444]KRN07323.1 hypothetical protein FD00_GL000211 [Liquorilactobacillus mali KCTC 3596 = DSM 20444]QFQ74972.1 hypothetical protein LM596_07490 [Liquorilactobacillus mali]